MSFIAWCAYSIAWIHWWHYTHKQNYWLCIFNMVLIHQLFIPEGA